MGVIAGPPAPHRRRLAPALILALALSCLAAAPALARDLPSLPNDSTEGWQAWQLSLVKTVTYRLIASVDVLIGGYLLTGSEIETLGLAAAVGAEKSLLYYGHELAWNEYGPPPDQMSPVDRSLAKAITYRALSMVNVFTLSYLATDSVEISAAFVAASALYSTSIYFLHEVMWNQYGPVPQSVRH